MLSSMITLKLSCLIQYRLFVFQWIVILLLTIATKLVPHLINELFQVNRKNFFFSFFYRPYADMIRKKGHLAENKYISNALTLIGYGTSLDRDKPTDKNGKLNWEQKIGHFFPLVDGTPIRTGWRANLFGIGWYKSTLFPSKRYYHHHNRRG